MGTIQRAVLLAVILAPAGLAVSRSASAPQPQQARGNQSGSNQSGGSQPANNRGDVERGRYLVEEVAKCYECHTPRNAQGELQREQWLQGAPTYITPVPPIRNWSENAPPLAGFPSYTDEQGERILEQGTGPEGETLRPPMHTYHLTPQDAKAIIAYLRSLPRTAR